jgi:hypothetical protein
VFGFKGKFPKEIRMSLNEKDLLLKLFSNLLEKGYVWYVPEKLWAAREAGAPIVNLGAKRFFSDSYDAASKNEELYDLLDGYRARAIPPQLPTPTFTNASEWKELFGILRPERYPVTTFDGTISYGDNVVVYRKNSVHLGVEATNHDHMANAQKAEIKSKYGVILKKRIDDYWCISCPVIIREKLFSKEKFEALHSQVTEKIRQAIKDDHASIVRAAKALYLY